ncbi:ABC transporter permease [Georgenia sp. H159]|uniref:ABC transporter permease n=1 Tax=Georgenia sp. H159 TaxID=3076115 RepID=UPI002D790C3D|nr:ABC transporter permease subunit [Georgenia sp. H159]
MRATSVRLVPIADKVLALLIAGVLWQFLSLVSYRRSVASPLETLNSLVSIIADGDLWEPLRHTLQAWGTGLGIAILVAVPLGFLLGRLDFAYKASVVVIDFLRSIPAVALIPLAVLLFGTGLFSVVLLVAFAAFWPLLLQTIYGARDVDRVAQESFRAYSIGGLRKVGYLILPSASPYVATGVRIAAYVSLLIAIGVQLIMPSDGLGAEILVSQLSGALPRMYAFILISGILGVVINGVFAAIEARLLRWHVSHRPEVHA